MDASCRELAARMVAMSVSAAECSNKAVLPTSSSSDESEECGKYPWDVMTQDETGFDLSRDAQGETITLTICLILV